jgi:hypothetical protein
VLSERVQSLLQCITIGRAGRDERVSVARLPVVHVTVRSGVRV